MMEQYLNIQAPLQVYTQDPEAERACRVCGCHELDACQHDLHGNCWWVEADLCSHCLYWPAKESAIH
jgi:hypothetical protein